MEKNDFLIVQMLLLSVVFAIVSVLPIPDTAKTFKETKQSITTAYEESSIKQYFGGDKTNLPRKFSEIKHSWN